MALQLAQVTPREMTPSGIKQVRATKKLVDEILGDLHRLSRHIHPSQLEHISLTTALSSLCDEFTRRSGMPIEFSHRQVAPNLPVDVKICLYRVAQEAIRNAEQHSGADRIHVELTASADSIRAACRTRAGALPSARPKPGEGLAW